MKQFKLNQTTLDNIRQSTGVAPHDMSRMNISELDAAIEKKIGKRLKPVTEIAGITSRGSVYLMFNRLLHPGQIDKILNRIHP